MIKMSRKAKKAMAVALTAGMLASTAVTPVMAATQGWKQNSKGWWYQNADGSYPANKWSKINGVWYYFDANGYMLANSWVKDSKGIWYYVGSNGAMKTNAWAQDKAGLWYYVTEDGSMYGGGWKLINGKWYFFKNDGAMQSGVVNVAGKTYYMGASNDGAMKTGKVSIETVEYNFNEDGACTDAKVPETTKVFDKKGNPVTPEVEIEKVNGINGAITNAISEYSEYGNVIIAGNDAYFKVLVTQNGEPVVGTPVALTSKRITGKDAYDVKGSNVATTDAQGYATFVFGVDKEYAEDNGDVTATSGHGALYELTANAVAINKEYKTDVAFANVYLGAVTESTCSATDVHNAIVPAENSTNPKAHSKVVEAYGINGLTKSEYVPSQQVSTGTTSDHALTFSVSPVLEIPTKESEEKVDTYHIDVNKTISEYSVYEDGGKAEIIIDNIPGEIAYGNLNLENLNISEYTKVEIKTYTKSDDKEVPGLTKVIDGANTSKNVTYQIPRNTSTGDKYIKVRIISEGQVNDDKNGGLTIKDFEGIYDETDKAKTIDVSLSNSVTWTQETIKYSEEKTLTEAEFKACLQGADEGKYVKNGYNYSYVVPAFPYVGNAIITVKDSNKKVVAYFSLPTENVKKNGDHTNVNDIKDSNGNIYYSDKAILISEDEALKTVGTITTNGNSVTVNSSEVGVTALKAKINIEGFEDQINLKNNTLYTSVHWAPVPNATEESDDFYALTGQYITVTAQLVDKNGNKSAKADAAVTFTYNKDGKVESVANGTVGEMATAYGLSSTVKTDKNGQVSFKISADDSEALVQGLSASSSSGDVVLTIGGKSVDTANLHWVKPGLAFTSSVNSENTTVDERKVVSDIDNFEGVDVAANFVRADEIADKLGSELTKEVGSNWIFGFEVVGDTKDIEDGTKDVWADSIEGLKINLSKDGDATLTTEGLANGVAKITSTKNTPTKLTGKLDAASTSNVVFNIKKTGDTETTAYANVGEGTAKFDSSLTIPIAFGASGLTTDFIFPQGQNIAIDTTSGIDSTDVYIVAKDSFGNRVHNKPVEYTVTYYGKDAQGAVKVIEETDTTPETTTTDTTIEGKTDDNGLVKVTLKEQAGVTIYQADITVKIDEESDKTEVKFVEAPKTPFALVGANYVEPATGETNGTIELAFSSNVLGSSVVSTDMFYVYDDIGELKIKDAKEKDGKIVLTLADTNKTLTRGDKFTVTIKNKDDAGITYKVCDVNGRILADTATVNGVAATNSISVGSVSESGVVTLTNVDTSKDEVIVVFDGSQVKIGNDATGYVKIAANSSLGAIQYTGTEDTTVTFYSKGAKTELKLEKLAVAKVGEVQTGDSLSVTFNREIIGAGTVALQKKGEDGNYSLVSGTTVTGTVDGEDKSKVSFSNLSSLDAGDYKLVITGIKGTYNDSNNVEVTFTRK